MDAWERLVEISDSLWFSSNILTASSRPSADNGEVAQALLEDLGELKQPQACPVSVQQAKVTSSRDGNKEAHRTLPVKRDRKVRKSSVLVDKEEEKRWALERQEIKGFLDLGFALEQIGLDKRLIAIIRELQNVRDGEVAERPMCPSLGYEIPPLNNGMVMKEHLRSWAYAVACTVK